MVYEYYSYFVMSVHAIVKVIEDNGVDSLKEILSKVKDTITPKNLPEYYPREKEGNQFGWYNVPYFCGNLQRELTEFFGVPTEIGFTEDTGWYLSVGILYSEAVPLDSLRYVGGKGIDWDALFSVLPNDYVGKVNAINEEPFKQASIKEYYGMEDSEN